MLKDRKFWTGMIAGCCVMGAVSFAQPMNAAGDAEDTKKLLKVMIEMVKEQRKTNQALTELKQINQGTTNAINNLAKTQSFNEPPSAGRNTR